jgi:hypothetical protein
MSFSAQAISRPAERRGTADGATPRNLPDDHAGTDQRSNTAHSISDRVFTEFQNPVRYDDVG